MVAMLTIAAAGIAATVFLAMAMVATATAPTAPPRVVAAAAPDQPPLARQETVS